jgi:hypothetical protein
VEGKRGKRGCDMGWVQEEGLKFFFEEMDTTRRVERG